MSVYQYIRIPQLFKKIKQFDIRTFHSDNILRNVASTNNCISMSDKLVIEKEKVVPMVVNILNGKCNVVNLIYALTITLSEAEQIIQVRHMSVCVDTRPPHMLQNWRLLALFFNFNYDHAYIFNCLLLQHILNMEKIVFFSASISDGEDVHRFYGPVRVRINGGRDSRFIEITHMMFKSCDHH